MKGVIFTEFNDMVRSQFGLELLDQIINDIHSSTEGAYTAVGTYPEREMFDLVAALSRRVDLSQPDLLRAFGKHLFGRLATLYPIQIQHAESCFELLESLEAVIHPNVQKLYPDAMLPRFDTQRVEQDCLQMKYESPRALSDLAHGLIEGCASWYGDKLIVQKEPLGCDGTTALFIIRRLEADE